MPFLTASPGHSSCLHADNQPDRFNNVGLRIDPGWIGVWDRLTVFHQPFRHLTQSILQHSPSVARVRP